jgi:hypothetical protein
MSWRPKGGRNTMRVNPIDDVDLTIAKYFGVGKEDRFELRLEGRFFEHPEPSAVRRRLH